MTRFLFYRIALSYLVVPWWVMFIIVCLLGLGVALAVFCLITYFISQTFSYA